MKLQNHTLISYFEVDFGLKQGIKKALRKESFLKGLTISFRAGSRSGLYTRHIGRPRC